MSLKSKNIPYVLIFLFLSYIAFAYSNDLSWSFFREVKFENGSFELKDPLIGAALHLFGIIVVQLILLRHVDCDKGVGMIISGHEYRDSLSRH